MDIEELAHKAGTDRRQVRFLISEGIVPHADGSRKFPAYGDHHLAAILRFRALRDDGMTVTAIRELVSRPDKPAPVILKPVPGISVSIDGLSLPDGVDVPALSLAIAKTISEFMPKEAPDADDR